MFQRSYLDARRSETLTLTDRELIVDRIAPDGEREQHRLDAYWLKVDQGERLVVTSRGNRVVIGRFLSPGEREEVGEQLKAALADLRSPRYEHDGTLERPARPSCRRGRASCPSATARARTAPEA